MGEFVEESAPYSFLNAVPGLGRDFVETLALRVRTHLPASVPNMSATDTSRYHGGWLADELAALCGLLMGIRLRPGGVSRDFYRGDPLGRPRADVDRPPSPLPGRYKSPIIPRAFEHQDIGAALLPLFNSYPLLSPPEAISLIRGARLHQDGLWLAEGQPALAWLLFVSALEVVSVHHQASTFSREQILKDWKPKLHSDLDKAGGLPLISKVAKHLERQLDAGKRLLAFIETFRPPSPPRPSGDHYAISWEWANLEAALKRIYDYRSRALHDGTPFPDPMCGPAMQGGRYVEKPDSIATATRDAAWLSEDLPMLLHVFEHITRSTIVSWWRSLAERIVAGKSLRTNEETLSEAPAKTPEVAADANVAKDAQGLPLEDPE